MSTAISRLDLTIDRAIGVIAAVLALSFTSVDSPPYFLLIGMLALTIFLVFDVRRYRSFDATRSRVRMIEGTCTSVSAAGGLKNRSVVFGLLLHREDEQPVVALAAA